MRSPIRTITVGGAALLAALMSLTSTADAAARRNGLHGNNHIGNTHISKSATHNRRIGRSQRLSGSRHINRNYNRKYRRGYGGGGFRLVVPGVSIYSNSGADGCNYSYRKWQVTGSRYWRRRYYDCRNG